jgi:hypothetical protein
LARVLTIDGDQTETAEGYAPSGMSPEQILTPQRVDHRSDVYNLGVLLYEILSQRT